MSAAPPSSVAKATSAVAKQDLEQKLDGQVQDGISSVKFFDDNLLVVSSWDSSVGVYNVAENKVENSYQHKAAVLDACFVDKNHICSGGIDRTVKFFDRENNSDRVLGHHEDAIKCVSYAGDQGMVLSASWDRSMKLWDTRIAESNISTISLPGKAYTLDHMTNRLVVGTSDRHILVYDSRKLNEPLQKRTSSLKYQTRCIRCFPNGLGYAVSSVEGRVAIEYFDTAAAVQQKSYAFKCHRKTEDGVDLVYPVNAIAFHPEHGTFATGGCDATVSMWDGENRKKLANWKHYPTSISSLSFNASGSKLAIAASYTWEQGETDHPKDTIYIRTMREKDVKPKARRKA